jgi:DNA-binding Xre family transcriptional regulator
MQVSTMPLRSNLNVLLAQKNLERAQVGGKPLTWFDVAKAANLTHSALLKLARGESSRIDFETIDKLMDFFGTNDLNAIFTRIPDES